MACPGMIQRPTAAITICVDRGAADGYDFGPTDSWLFVDVGTGTVTLMLDPHALRIGAGPVSSFSRAAVGAVLRLPADSNPELIVCLGHPAPAQPAPMNPEPSLHWKDLTLCVPAARDEGE